MANYVTVEPIAAANTNPLSIVFGATALIEFIQMPEKLLNKDVSGLELIMVDTIGVYLEKGPLNALIPWSNILTFQY